MTSFLDLSLPSTAPNTEPHYATLDPQYKYKFAVYTIANLEHATLQALENELNSAKSTENTCKLAPDPSFPGRPLRHVFDYRIRIRNKDTTVHPLYFIVATDLDYKTNGLIVVHLNTAQDDEKDRVDQGRCEVDMAASWGINIDMGNMCWEDLKDEEERIYGHNPNVLRPPPPPAQDQEVTIWDTNPMDEVAEEDVFAIDVPALPESAIAENKVLHLGILDQVMIRMHVPVIFCFPMPDQRHTAVEKATKVLRDAAQTAVRRWPFLAGKLYHVEGGHRKNMVEVGYVDPPHDVVRSGVFQAKAIRSVGPYEELSKMGMPSSALDCEMLTSRPLSGVDRSLPVLNVQANFIRGGLLLAFSFTHSVMDGISMSQLFNHFASCTRNLPFQQVFCCTVNTRTRHPAFPPSYFGNAVAWATATAPLPTLLTTPTTIPTLTTAALAIRASLTAIDAPAIDARMRAFAAMADPTTVIPDIAARIDKEHTGVFLTSWATLGAREECWGAFGRAEWVRKPWWVGEGVVCVLPRREGGDWEVLVGLGDGDMEGLVREMEGVAGRVVR